MKRFCLLVTLLAFSFYGNAQKLGYEQGSVLIRLRDGESLKTLSSELSRFDQQYTGFQLEERLSESLNIWKATFDHTRINAALFSEFLEKNPRIISASRNHLVQSRSTVPNDPDFSRQWPFLNTGQTGGTVGEDVDMDLAWDLTTGGISTTGDTIVVCIIDDGMDTGHRDFEGNLWKNYGEIPGNGIDDDGNGYVDDFHGWNTALDRDEISDKNEHGTPVAGIVGARGNNNLGVSGINWQVKLMIIAADNLLNTVTEAELLQAYDYVLETRKLYNNSGGQKGAFVVAANTSWGSAGNFPSDAPFWCQLFDELGKVGVLNVAATDNQNTNVETQGDLPSLCPSDYLIVVTNVDKFGQKVERAAYGAYSVDLASYGQGVYTTAKGDNYDNFSGTSFAAPQVAGAIALLYAAPCNNLSLIARSDPASAALLAKSYILNGVVANASLQDITVTGGNLNVYNSIRLLEENCQDCVPVTGVSAAEIGVNSADITWINHLDHTRTALRWKALTDADWIYADAVTSPFMLEGLQSCTDYEVQLQPICGEKSPGYAPSFVFTSDGCCRAPDFINVDPAFISDTRAFVAWPGVTAATGYKLRYRPSGAGTWDSVLTSTNQYFLTALTSCTVYELEVETLCAAEVVAEYAVGSFRTLGCGACLEKDYCEPSNVDAAVEWIARVKVGDFEQNSLSNGGYGDFTAAPASVVLNREEAYEIKLSPGFASSVGFNEYFRVWVDLNHNGLFTSSEIVWESSEGSKTEQTGTITIAATALTGNTRMRIGMLSQSGISACNFSTRVFGEYEDYCVEIRDGSTATTDRTASFSVACGPNPVSDLLNIQLGNVEEDLMLEIWNINGIRQGGPTQVSRMQSASFELDCSDLPNGLYWLRLSGEKSGSATFRVVVLHD